MAERETVFKRVYEGIKARVISGQFRPGDRVDAEDLADKHISSVAPVRQALHRIVGEQLLEYHPNDGFHVPSVTEPQLRHLYQWNCAILDAALAMSMRHQMAGLTPPRPKAADLSKETVAATEQFFLLLAAQSGNSYGPWTIRIFNDHLQPARRMEAALIPDRDQEIQRMAALLEAADVVALSRAMHEYHDRRTALVTHLVELLHQNRGDDALSASSR